MLSPVLLLSTNREDRSLLANLTGPQALRRLTISREFVVVSIRVHKHDIKVSRIAPASIGSY
jgi:hypothetical protein